jgi:hypothetical protein
MTLPTSRRIEVGSTAALLVLVGVIVCHLWLPEVVAGVQTIVETVIVPFFGFDSESIAG